MSNSINPVNPMMQPLVDPQDYVKTAEVIVLCEEFTRAVLNDLDTQGRMKTLAGAMTQDEIADIQYIGYLLTTMPETNDQEIAEKAMIGIALCDIFAEIVSRVEPDDDEIVKHIPPAMATKDTLRYLEKYQMDALANYVRQAIP